MKFKTKFNKLTQMHIEGAMEKGYFGHGDFDKYNVSYETLLITDPAKIGKEINPHYNKLYNTMNITVDEAMYLLTDEECTGNEHLKFNQMYQYISKNNIGGDFDFVFALGVGRLGLIDNE